MKCPFFEGKHINYCSAYHKLMVPSLDEIESFCITDTDKYNTCPVLNSYAERINLECQKKEAIGMVFTG